MNPRPSPLLVQPPARACAASADQSGSSRAARYRQAGDRRGATQRKKRPRRNVTLRKNSVYNVVGCNYDFINVAINDLLDLHGWVNMRL